MKIIYFVTEGKTDKFVIQALIEKWIGDQDFLVRHVQPPTSAYVEGLDTNLSEGWKGVLDWCKGGRPNGPAGRNEALRLADCLIVHMDADVAFDADFKSPPFATFPPVDHDGQCSWVQNELRQFFDESALEKILFCIPAQDLEAWIVAALHPEMAIEHNPIERRVEPAALLVQKAPHRLVRRKEGKLKKQADKYEDAAPKIVLGWERNISSGVVNCSSAVRFEGAAKAFFQR